MPASPHLGRAIAVSLLLAFALGASRAMAVNGGDAVLLEALPAPVAAATWCAEDGPGFATRRVFAGRVIFAVECPGNHANFIQALVVADDEEGRNARALVFPTPYPSDPDNPNDALANVEWHEGGIVSELFVDPEAIDGPCRHEARWRLEGPSPQPVLIFWRETNDCDGKGGWTVLVGA
jgi:hypothetical protein